ncbi:C40 family peptidase [Bacillus sp. AK128]
MIRRILYGIVTCFFSLFLFSSIASANSDVNYDKLLPVAKKYVGIPYQHGGTTPSGFDCSGYIGYVYDNLGISLPRTTSQLYNTGASISKGNLRVGDLVFFNTSGSGVSHAGIYIGNDQFIHSSSSKGISVSSINDPYYWGKRYLGARRILDMPLDQGAFKDISKNHWAEDAISTLAEENLVIGYAGSQFKPNDYITRAEVAAYLAQYLELNLANRSSIFNDVSSKYWAVGTVNALYKEGYVKGSNGNYNPEGTLTRDQMAALLTRVFNLKSASTPISFSDVSISHWAYNDIQSLAASGITVGYPDQSFRPDEPVTRAQFAAFLYRAIKK